MLEAWIVGLLVSALMIKALLVSGLAWKMVDIPNHRSLHQLPTPRVGGIGIIAAVVIGAIVIPLSYRLEALLWITFPLVLVSAADDKWSLPARWRFLVQLLCALIWCVYSQALAFTFWPILFLSIVWMGNLYNFMDGSDGLAGGMALIGFATYAYAATGVNHDIALLSMLITGGALGFLLFNFHPAKVFMGDAGSVSLGFMAAMLGLDAWLSDVWPWWFPVVVFSPFIADATVTLLKRAWQRQRVWEAHREHFYQRMVQAGWGHRKTALSWYVVMLVNAVIALMLLQNPDAVMPVLIGWVTVYLGAIFWLNKKLPSVNR